MTPDLNSETRQRIEQEYAPNDREAVIALVAELPEPRVQKAVLALADGDVDKLLHYAQAAVVDWRDVLWWAETRTDDDLN